MTHDRPSRECVICRSEDRNIFLSVQWRHCVSSLAIVPTIARNSWVLLTGLRQNSRETNELAPGRATSGCDALQHQLVLLEKACRSRRRVHVRNLGFDGLIHAVGHRGHFVEGGEGEADDPARKQAFPLFAVSRVRRDVLMKVVTE